MANSIIENVRRSLGRTAQAPLTQHTPVYPPRCPESVESETERFLEEVRNLSGSAQKLSLEMVQEALKTLVVDNGIHKATLWRTPLFELLGIEKTLRSLDVELVSPNADKNEMAQCDLGITEADYLLAETGTLVLRSSVEKPRAVSLLPRIHLAIVHPGLLRHDLHQVFAEAKDSPYLLFVIGPSRTADIELTVTLGVHGPKGLHVWMIAG